MLKKLLTLMVRWLPPHLRTNFAELLGASLEPNQASEIIQKIVRHHVNVQSPEHALRFLFRLDAVLYTIQGHQAILYDNGLHTKYRHTRYNEFFLERVHPGQKVIDIGCGGGLLAFRLAQKGTQVVGMDISQAKIDQARQKYAHNNLKFLQGNALTEFDSGTFDVVVLSNVLEHLTGRVAFLKQIVQRYQPPLLLIRVPLFERDWRVPLKKELGVEWRLDRTHETEYTEESFAEEILASGLTIRHKEIRWGELWGELVVSPKNTLG